MPSARAWGWMAATVLAVTLVAGFVSALLDHAYAAGVIVIVGIAVAMILARGYGYAKDRSP